MDGLMSDNPYRSQEYIDTYDRKRAQALKRLIESAPGECALLAKADMLDYTLDVMVETYDSWSIHDE